MTYEYDIEIYATEDGREPFSDWVNSIKDKKTKASVFLRLQRVRRGNFGYSKSLDDGLYELKIDIGPGLRIYFANIEDRVVLLLGGGGKKTQDRDINRCKEFLEDYKRGKK